MIRTLPIFKGYTVDARLKQFRCFWQGELEIVEFDTDLGDELLTEYIQTLDDDSPEFKEICAIL